MYIHTCEHISVWMMVVIINEWMSIHTCLYRQIDTCTQVLWTKTPGKVTRHTKPSAAPTRSSMIVATLESCRSRAWWQCILGQSQPPLATSSLVHSVWPDNLVINKSERWQHVNGTRGLQVDIPWFTLTHITHIPDAATDVPTSALIGHFLHLLTLKHPEMVILLELVIWGNEPLFRINNLLFPLR